LFCTKRIILQNINHTGAYLCVTQEKAIKVRIALESMVLAGSPADTMNMYNIEGEQW